MNRFFLLLTFLVFYLSRLSAQVNEQDSLALVALYESTDGDNWINNTNWLIGDVDTWFGITLNDDFRVSHLNLNSNRLIGSLPDELGQLTELTSLLLSSNELTGEIPEGLGNLSELYELSLSLNYLSGSIPSSLGNLTKAVQINISGNQLEGNVPENIFLIDGLSTLWVGNNPLSGPLPAAVTLTTAQNMTFFNTDLCIPNNQTFELWCDNNYMCDALKICDDPSISTLDSLNLVYIYENLGGENWTNNTGWLTAPIVQWHGITVANGSVTEIDLSDNNLVGELMSGWINGVNYSVVDLSANDLSGQLPTGIDGMYSLMNLDLSATNLEGKIPSEIIYSRSLTHLDFSNTNLCEPTTVAYINFTQGLQEYGATVTCDYLGADVQDSLALVAFYQATQGASWRRNDHWLDTPVHEWYGVKLDGDGKVISLELSANAINGQLPTMLPILLELDQLEILNLQDNLLIDGPIPNSIDGFTNLRTLNLSYCQLGGSIPAEIGNMTTLEVLGLSGNNLYDEVPASIYSLSRLQVLVFHGNNLHGLVPEQVSDLSELSTFVIYDNPLLCEPISSAYEDWTSDLSTYINSNTCAAPYGDFVKDSLALVALYESTDGDNWINNDNWLEGDVDIWYGVTVEDDRVTDIWLLDNGLEGNLPEELSYLSELKGLTIVDSKLTGNLPASLFDLTNLEVLRLLDNELTGTLPSAVGRLTSLKELDLKGNMFSGTLPEGIASLDNLSSLILDGNSFDGGLSYVTELDQLRGLSISNNTFSGSFPEALTNLKLLTFLDLSSNNFSGNLPATLGELDDLQALRIGMNDFTGTVPIELTGLPSLLEFKLADNLNLCEPTSAVYTDWVAGLSNYENFNTCLYNLKSDSLALVALYESTDGDNWTNNTNWLTDNVDTWYGVGTISDRIDSLNLHDNNLSGTIPEIITQLSELRYLNLQSNNLTGTIPLSIGTFKQLEVFNISRNGIEGLIPIEIGALTNLRELVLNGNQITGSIPLQLEYISGLSDLFLGSNLFEGNIPSNLGNLTNLRTLDLSNNLLEGSIPPELGELNDLERLWLFGNQLGGDIPDELGALSSLQQLFLSNNNITGEIPSELGNLENLEQITLSTNNLSGNIPNSIGNLSKVWELNLSSNNLSGPIPVSMGDLSNIRVVNLAFNQLNGSIPIELGNLPLLGSLSLRSNLLSGNIPDIFDLSTLYHLDISANELTGSVPSEISNLTSLTTLKLQGNPLTGSIPLSITALTNLAPSDFNAFDFSNTSLCEPTDQAWLDWKQARYIVSSGLVCSNGSEILTFSFDGQIGESIVDTENAEINVKMPIGTDLTRMVADFNVSSGGSAAICPEKRVVLEASADAQVYSLGLVGEFGLTKPDITIAQWTTNGQATTNFGLIDFQFPSLPVNAEITSAKLSLYCDPTKYVYNPTLGHSQLSGSNATYVQRVTSEWTELVNWTTKPSFTDVNQLIIPASSTNTQDYPDIDVSGLVVDMYNDPDNSHGFRLKMVSDQSYRLMMFASSEHPEAALHPKLEIVYSTGNNAGTNVESGITELDYSSPVCIEVTASDGQTMKQWTVSVEMEEEVKSLYTDSLALVALYESTDGDNWTRNDNWLSGSLDSWWGIQLLDRRVTAVNFNQHSSIGGNNLNGILPVNLSDLSELKELDLTNNNIHGEIPDSFKSLSNLTELKLQRNDLGGFLPQWLGALSNLKILDLSGNRFEGSIPSSLGNLYNISSLDLSHNALSNGMPLTLFELSGLQSLDLSYNRLSGTIPTEVGGLGALKELKLNNNLISGVLPDQISHLGELVRLELQNNSISGVIPASLGELSNIWFIDLSDNSLVGNIPKEFGKLSQNYLSLRLNDNDLNGIVPEELISIGIMRAFVISNNPRLCEPSSDEYINWAENRITSYWNTGTCMIRENLLTDSLALVALYQSTNGDSWTNNTNWLTGDVDTWYGVGFNGTRVSSLELFNNNLTGEFPDDIGQLTEVVHLNLSSNNMSGIIPTTVGRLTQLAYLYLEENQLTGPIPEEIVDLVKLKYLHLHTNQLSNDIPNTLGQLTLLEDLHLASNQLTGAIPVSIGALASIKSIDLGDNNLTGEIPTEIGQLTALESLVLNRNNLSGSIPASFGLLINLDYFSLTDNALSGGLPAEIGNMESLRVFDIERNNLSGELPNALADLSRLERVYLFGNQLEGTIPKGFLELNLLTELVIYDNLIDSIPNVSQTKPDLRLLAHTNRLTFEDLEPNITIFESISHYSPQRQFGHTQTVSINGDSEVELSQGSVGGTANNYQWYKDEELIEGATSEEYEIENSSLESEGTYALRVTNALVPGLTLESHPIELIYEPRTEKEILSYSVPGEFAPADIDESVRSIIIYLPCDAPDIATPSFELSGGAQAFVDDEAQVSGVTSVDMSEPVTYTVVAEDGSQALWTISVAHPNPIGIFSTILHLSSCNTSNGSITIDSIRLDSDLIVILPDSRYSLQWSNASTGHNIAVSSEGNYSVEVTDNETGCSYIRSFDVLTKDLEGALSLREKQDNTSCVVANGFLSVDANIGSSQGLGYAWYKGTTASGAVIGETKAIDNLEAGSYTLVVTDLDSDCTTSLTEAIEDAQQALDIRLKSTANKSCAAPTGTIELTTITVDGEERTSTLGYRIEWSQTEGFEEVFAQTREVNGLASGTYYARLIGVATACTSPVRSITIVDDQPSLNFNVSTTPNSRCDDTGNGSATLTSLPEDHQIQWYSGETLLQSKTSPSINALTSGNYKAVVTDHATGCEATSTFEIENATPKVTFAVASNENTSCGEPVGEARVVAVYVGEQRTTNLEAFSFEWWLPNEEVRLIQGRASQLTNILGGDYFVQVTLDSIGCQSAPLKTTVEEDIQNFAVALTQSRPDLPGAQGTGQLQVEILEQPEEYTISWYEGDLPTGFVIGESATLDNVNEGLYTILVTDQRTGCEVTATFEVGVDERLAQEISFDLPEIVNIADLPLTLEATSDQGLPVSFTVVEGQGTISQNQLTAEAKGTIVIKAYNEGTTAVAYAESLRTLKVMSDFYLTGAVTGAADGSQVSGEVVVFTLDGEVFAQNSFTDGSYFIDGLREGKYRLLIEVTGAFNALAFDTYYNRQLLWNRATILTINDDTEVNVELIPKTNSNMTGTGSITGRVVRTDGGSRIVVGRTLDGTPLADVDIYLYDRSTNDVVAQSKTDDDGVFLFANIPSGQYYFRIDAVGYELADLGADIDYDEEEGTLQISAALGQEGLTVEYAVISGVEEELLKDISIYPNPVLNILHVKDALNRIRSIQLLNLTGQLIRSFDTSLDGQYDLSSLTNGMYIMRIELVENQLVHYKVLISH